MKLSRLMMSSLVLLVLCSTAVAQETRPHRDRDSEEAVQQRLESRRQRERARWQSLQLSTEEAEATWTWRAKSVAHDLELDDQRTRQLIETYVEASKQYEATMHAKLEAGDEGDLRLTALAMADWYRQSLGKELAGFLTPEQTDQAMTSLGMFSRWWDFRVATIIGFDLGAEKTILALQEFNAYHARIAREGPRRSGAAADFMKGLAKVLSEEQVVQLYMGPGRGVQRDSRERREQVADTGIGEPAPGFTLADSNGESHTLTDYKGKIVVLQWINPECLVCRRTSSGGKVVAMRTQLDEITDDVVHLMINSTHDMEPTVSARYLMRYKIDAPVLIDRDGTVGHLYGAKRTPHAFVIDSEGVLRYQGAIDDDPSGDKGLEANNYVVQAVRQITAGETVASDVMKSYGCTIKYKP